MRQKEEHEILQVTLEVLYYTYSATTAHIRLNSGLLDMLDLTLPADIEEVVWFSSSKSHFPCGQSVQHFCLDQNHHDYYIYPIHCVSGFPDDE